MTTLRRALSKFKRAIYRPTRPSLNGLDQKLEKYLDFRDGFFIEAGANDGYTQSNTYYLEKSKGWRGILVEGIPELYQKCKRTRANSTVHHCALVSREFTATTVKMHFADLMSVVDGSMKTEQAQQHHLQDGMHIQHLDNPYSVDVPARTLESILDATPNLPSIDFFSLDVEGYEVEVLKGLNLEKYAPKYLLVEAWFYDEIASLLSDRYEQLEQLSYHDFLFRVKTPRKTG